jgi:anhydro-N-acetylmuramic acid kinase
MLKDVMKLNALGRRRRRTIIGLMSGTSLDGLDVALCDFYGSGKNTRVKLRAFETVSYDEAFKHEIRKVFAQKVIDFQHLVLLNVLIAERHAEIVNQCLRSWKVPSWEVDLLASHGQTVFHAPKSWHGLDHYPNATLQIGDGDHLALRTNIMTVSDFRQKHIAAGGEGAPLAIFGDYLLFSQRGEDRYLLNIGGIANFTYLNSDRDPDAVFATDTGPGNTLIDAFSRRVFEVPYDSDARLAANGRVDPLLLEILKSDPFFQKPFPKTTGPEYFSVEWVQQAIAQIHKGNINPYDLIATLSQLTADTIAEAIERVAQEKKAVNRKAIYLSGGGAHNPYIVKQLTKKLRGFKLFPMKNLGVPGDAKEAVLFAVLANETVAGIEGAPLGPGKIAGLSLGKISFPH